MEACVPGRRRDATVACNGPLGTPETALRAFRAVSWPRLLRTIQDPGAPGCQARPPRVARTPPRAGSAVREILANPKYTGYMVWNRRASKKGGQHNSAADWVWSPQPRHEPLVTRDLFEAASPVGRRRQGSRTRAGANSHPQTSRSYPLRSYVFCDLCDRRMFGKTRHQHAYYACQPDPHHHDGRAGWYPAHPASLWVREDTLVDLVCSFFAERIPGPGRHDLLRTQFAVRAGQQDDHAQSARQARLHTLISDIERRRKNLITSLNSKTTPAIPRPTRSTGRASSGASLSWPPSTGPAPENSPSSRPPRRDTRNDPDLLTRVPQLPLVLGALPEALQRSLLRRLPAPGPIPPAPPRGDHPRHNPGRRTTHSHPARKRGGR